MSGRKRPRCPMPPDVKQALAERGLTAAYGVRPDYQQNDYIGWIARAKADDTRRKRLDQMLDELERGDAYMGMAYRTRERRSPGESHESEQPAPAGPAE